MACISIPNGIVCVSDGFYRFRLRDGTCVFMEWHHYIGPLFSWDRAGNREIDDWYMNPMICEALEWFQGRGNRA